MRQLVGVPRVLPSQPACPHPIACRCYLPPTPHRRRARTRRDWARELTEGMDRVVMSSSWQRRLGRKGSAEARSSSSSKSIESADRFRGDEMGDRSNDAPTPRGGDGDFDIATNRIAASTSSDGDIRAGSYGDGLLYPIGVWTI